MLQAFSYVRFSSSQQQHGASLARQQDMVGKWLVRNPDYALSELSFQDLGRSGYSGAHLENAFGRLLAAVENGAIPSGSKILIEAIDRAGRLEPMEMLPLLSKIVKAGVSLVTLDDGIEYDRESVNSNHLFLLVAKVQQAYQYSDTLSRRVKDAYARKRELAATGGGATRRTPLWLDADGQLVEDLAPIIQSIFRDYADGIGERRILARVRGQHPLLESLNPTTIKKWLKNPTAVGRWKDIEGVYPAVVPRDLWFRVQKRLADGTKLKSASSVYMMSGLVVCGRCSRNFGVTNTKRSPPAMLCMARHRLGEAGCSNSRSIPMHILTLICSQTMQQPLHRAAASQNLSENEKRLIAIDGEVADLHRKSENLVELLAEHGKALPSIGVKLDRLTSSLEALEQERALLRTSPVAMSTSEIISLENELLDEDPERLNALLRGVGYKIVCDGTRITVDEPHLQYGGYHQVFEYLGSHRPTETYRLSINGDVFAIDMPNSKRVAADYAAFVVDQEHAFRHKK